MREGRDARSILHMQVKGWFSKLGIHRKTTTLRKAVPTRQNDPRLSNPPRAVTGGKCHPTLIIVLRLELVIFLAFK